MDTKLPAELRYEANEHVAVITLNRPQERNALDERLTLGLQIAVARIKASPALRVVFLTGNGPMFCAGGDPKGFQRMAAAAAMWQVTARAQSCLAWDMLRRKAFAPASSSTPMRSSVSVAGPNVAKIRVCRVPCMGGG